MAIDTMHIDLDFQMCLLGFEPTTLCYGAAH